MVFLTITHGDNEVIEMEVESNCNFKELRERISENVKMDKDDFHITKEDYNEEIVTWEVMSDNTIVDSSHRYILIVYSHKEWNNMDE